MIGAVVMEDKTIIHIERYTELLNFFNVDSAGLKKTMHTESPTTKRQTKNEQFIKLKNLRIKSEVFSYSK